MNVQVFSPPSQGADVVNSESSGPKHRVLGIDPGKDGAAVGLDGPDVFVALLLDPIVGGKKWEAVHQELSGWARTLHAATPISLIVLELHAGRPGEGAGSARTIGVGWGLWLGIWSALGVPVICPASQVWTKKMLADLPGEDKDRAIALCRARLPWLNLTPGRRVKPHTGLADAGGLALYGQRSLL